MKKLLITLCSLFFQLLYIILQNPVVCVHRSLKSAKTLQTTYSGVNFEIIGGNFRTANDKNTRNFGALNLKHCGKKLKASYIIGGIETVRNEFPFVVSLLRNGKLACTATIINYRWIISAAHCIVGANISSFSIVTGAHTSTVGDVYRVTRIIPHKDFSLDTHYADIVLIRVDRRIKFNDKVNAICLPTQPVSESTGVLTVAGWGRHSGDAPMKPSPTLQKVDITIISDKECSNIFASVSLNIYKSFICSLSNNGTQGTCNGDSGGPAFQYRNGRAVLVGITSFMYGWCFTDMPNVYTEVSHFIDWIYQTLKA